MAKRDNTIELAAKGMKNRSNFCFFNSSMQCILSINTFIKHYIDNPKLQGTALNFQSFLKNYSESSGATNPDQLISLLRDKIQLLNGRQQDSHEFLILFLDTLIKELPNYKLGGYSDIQKFKDFKASNHIADIFFGMHQVTTVCGKCKNINRFCGSFNALSLPIGDSIKNSLEMFSAENELKDMFCDKCKTKSIYTKNRIEVIESPKILVLHLLRFNGPNRKNDKLINIDEQIRLLSTNDVYNLVGMVCHTGVLSHGHYISHVCKKDGWYVCDDASVSKMKSPPTKGSNAYIIFYERK